MSVDVTVEIDIARPVAEVARFAGDPENVCRWYANIKEMQWQGAPGVRVGARMAFVARFLGRRIAYIYEIREHVPEQRLVMSTADGPFPMETTYTWSATGDGAAATHMTLRNRGEPSGFGRLVAPMMSAAIRRATRKDLARLKALLEAAPPAAEPVADPQRGPA